ncbi:hypothetical protein F5890DRAFT_1547020 [Lentinula detonsa]|uniref:Secreted protein n=2 Tax=Lentinula TaxID=5352 RepID=A0AA38PPF2_9AGAR|nr:hypothetical protein F5890DRAFT_1547020 [Lentinula detonsa]
MSSKVSSNLCRYLLELFAVLLAVRNLKTACRAQKREVKENISCRIKQSVSQSLSCRGSDFPCEISSLIFNTVYTNVHTFSQKTKNKCSLCRVARPISRLFSASVAALF